MRARDGEAIGFNEQENEHYDVGKTAARLVACHLRTCEGDRALFLAERAHTRCRILLPLQASTEGGEMTGPTQAPCSVGQRPRCAGKHPYRPPAARNAQRGPTSDLDILAGSSVVLARRR
eukprot:294652-Prymnesium_polylepis.1